MSREEEEGVIGFEVENKVDSSTLFIPPDELRCEFDECKNWRLHEKKFCQVHYLEEHKKMKSTGVKRNRGEVKKIEKNDGKKKKKNVKGLMEKFDLDDNGGVDENGENRNRKKIANEEELEKTKVVVPVKKNGGNRNQVALMEKCDLDVENGVGGNDLAMKKDLESELVQKRTEIRRSTRLMTVAGKNGDIITEKKSDEGGLDHGEDYKSGKSNLEVSREEKKDATMEIPVQKNEKKKKQQPSRNKGLETKKDNLEVKELMHVENDKKGAERNLQEGREDKQVKKMEILSLKEDGNITEKKIDEGELVEDDNGAKSNLQENRRDEKMGVPMKKNEKKQKKKKVKKDKVEEVQKNDLDEGQLLLVEDDKKGDEKNLDEQEEDKKDEEINNPVKKNEKKKKEKKDKMEVVKRNEVAEGQLLQVDDKKGDEKNLDEQEEDKKDEEINNPVKKNEKKKKVKKDKMEVVKRNEVAEGQLLQVDDKKGDEKNLDEQEDKKDEEINNPVKKNEKKKKVKKDKMEVVKRNEVAEGQLLQVDDKKGDEKNLDEQEDKKDEEINNPVKKNEKKKKVKKDKMEVVKRNEVAEGQLLQVDDKKGDEKNLDEQEEDKKDEEINNPVKKNEKKKKVKKDKMEVVKRNEVAEGQLLQVDDKKGDEKILHEQEEDKKSEIDIPVKKNVKKRKGEKNMGEEEKKTNFHGGKGTKRNLQELEDKKDEKIDVPVKCKRNKGEDKNCDFAGSSHKLVGALKGILKSKGEPLVATKAELRHNTRSTVGGTNVISEDGEQRMIVQALQATPTGGAKDGKVSKKTVSFKVAKQNPKESKKEKKVELPVKKKTNEAKGSLAKDLYDGATKVVKNSSNEKQGAVSNVEDESLQDFEEAKVDFSDNVAGKEKKMKGCVSKSKDETVVKDKQTLEPKIELRRSRRTTTGGSC